MPNSAPFFTIIIPVFNVEKYVTECINSVLGQSFSDFEIIAINDGSTDSSLKVLYQFQRLDSRIKVFDQKNAGLSEARNSGLRLATGRFIVFLDSDDLLSKSSLITMRKEIVANKLDVLLYGAEVFYDGFHDKNLRDYQRSNLSFNKVKNGRVMYVDLIHKDSFYASVCLYAISSKIAKSIEFIPNMYYEDGYYSMQILFSPMSVRVLAISDFLYLRRVRSNSITTVKPTVKHVNDNIKVAKLLHKHTKSIVHLLPKERKAIFIQANKSIANAYKLHLKLTNRLSWSERKMYVAEVVGCYCGLRSNVLLLKILFPSLVELLPALRRKLKWK